MADAAPAPPQLAVLVFREAIDNLDATFQQATKDLIGSYLFIEFCKKQIELSNLDGATINPASFRDKDDFFRIANDVRLRWRFWTDLLRLAEENAVSNRNNNEE